MDITCRPGRTCNELLAVIQTGATSPFTHTSLFLWTVWLTVDKKKEKKKKSNHVPFVSDFSASSDLRMSAPKACIKLFES